MTKQDYDRIKSKEEQIEQLLKFKKLIETSKILSINLRCFSDEKTEFENITLSDLPKNKIKHVLLENYETRLENAKKDYEDFFNEETIFIDKNDEI